jgi:hypothetical protein
VGFDIEDLFNYGELRRRIFRIDPPRSSSEMFVA